MSSEKKQKILIIEDEKMLSDIYASRFNHEGYDVCCAYDAEEGMNLTVKEKPDLVILDMLLPRANGIEYLEKKFEIKDIKEIPVIAYSNYDDKDYKKRSTELGVKDYLIKTNYTPQEIIETVKKHIAK